MSERGVRALIVRSSAFCCAALLAAGSAAPADKPLYAPPPAWVKPAPIPHIPPSTDGSAIQVLLSDTQARLGPDADETYSETAIRILTPQGLTAMANLVQVWNPDTDTLTFHRLAIVRGEQTIDVLNGGKAVTVLRRETNLQLAMLDGELTAAVQPEGLRVGDILDVAATISRRDPVMQGRSQAMAGVRFPGIAGRVRVRETWPETKPIRWRATEGLPTPLLTRSGGVAELVVDASNVAAPKAPVGAPARFNDVGELELSQFQSWAEVAALMAPLYDKAASLDAASPLRAEIDQIRRASADPKIRAEAALRVAEDKVHYVFLGMNFGGYIPAAADLTWSRRFGDCKGKTTLLLALLHGLGVEAEPALVSTTLGDGLDQRLPRLDVFDHVFVRARIGKKVYWLDATRMGDRDLDDIPLPDFHWVLPLRPQEAQLEKVEPQPFDVPAYESLERLDASAGLDTPAPAHIEHINRGDAAVVWRVALEAVGRADAERSLKEQWRQQYSWIDPKTVDYAYDEARHLMRLTMDGVAKMDWTHNSDVRDFDIADSSLGFNAAFKREPGPHADAPFAVNYPAYDKWTVQVILPRQGAGFRLAGAPAVVDQVVAGRRYQRSARIEQGVATAVAEELSLAPEFPSADAQGAAAALRELYRFNVVIRSPPASDASEDDSAVAEKPTDAAGYSARGVAFLRRHDFDHAIADFSEAARLEPLAAKHVYDRGAAYYEKGEDDLALKDFDQALRLEPHDVLALLARADLYLIKGDRARAEADYASATAIAPNPDVALYRRAAAHDRAGLFQDETRDFDAIMARAPNRAALPRLLNGRCWSRAEWGRELDAALTDCNAALVLTPDSAQILDSRGFVRFRLGLLQASLEDYEAALRLTPDRPASLFGRGLAKLALGRKSEAASDFATARRLSRDIDAEFARYGVRAPAAGAP